MRRLSIVFLISAFKALAVISLVTHAVGNASGGSTASTASTNTTGATLIVVVVAARGNAAQIVITDATGSCISPCNTWTTILNLVDNSGTSNVTIAYSANPTVGTGHVVSTTSVTSPSIFMAAFSGSGEFVDAFNSGAVGGSSIQPGSITPAANGELIVTGLETNNAMGTASINSSFSITDQVPGSGGSNYGGGLAWLAQPTAAAINPTWSYTNGVTSAASGIVAFRINAGNTQIGAFLTGP